MRHHKLDIMDKPLVRSSGKKRKKVGRMQAANEKKRTSKRSGGR